MKIKYSSLLFIGLIACTKKQGNVIPLSSTESAKTFIVKDLKANADLKGHFAFFNFKNNVIIPLADSNTTKWDIGLNGTKIIVNGGTSGPGGTEAQVVMGIYDEMTIAPEANYRTDDAKQVSAFAIPSGTGNGWYNYDGTTHIISAIPGRVLIFKTTDSRYVKMEVLSYYKGMPANPVNTDSARFYSFRYMYQPTGSRNF